MAINMLSRFLSILLILQSFIFPLGQVSHSTQTTNLQIAQSPLTVLEGSRGTIYSDYLDLTLPDANPDEVQYQLTDLPAYGRLELSGVGLSFGDEFTQADVDRGDLAYIHDGGETLADGFGYVAGTGLGELHRLALSSDTTNFPTPDVYPALSADGQWAAFPSSSAALVPGKTTTFYDIFLANVQTGQLVQVTQGISGQEPNGDSLLPYLSADGRILLYTSYASNLVEGDSNQRSDVFLYDAETGLTSLVSSNPDGQPTDGAGFGISGDGKRVLYLDINSATPRGLFVKDVQTEFSFPVSPNTQGVPAVSSDWAALSADGNVVAFDSYLSNLVPGDTNNANDIFVYELDTGLTERINVKTDGSQAADGMSLAPSISENGRYVAFESSSDGLVSGDQNGIWNIFVRDRQNGSTEMVDINGQGIQANTQSRYARISPDGRYVTFFSTATNLNCAATQTPKVWIFTHDSQTGQTWLASTPDDGQPITEVSAFSVVDNLGHTLYFSQARHVDSYLPGQNGFYPSTAVNPQRLCGNFDLKVAPVDDLPTPGTPEPIQAGRGSLTRLTSAQVQASDTDSPPEQIVYTLTGAPANGALVKGRAHLAPGEYFTQADLDAGLVSYWNDGSQVASDGLELTLSNVGPMMEYVSRANDGTPANSLLFK